MKRIFNLRHALAPATVVVLLSAGGCFDNNSPPLPAPTPQSTQSTPTGEPPALHPNQPLATGPGTNASGSQTAVEDDHHAAAGGDAEPPLFAGWPQPDFVLMIGGRQHGYIEPCGCTGLENQKGGLARRRTLQHQLTERGWRVVPLDVGNQVRRFGRQAEIKYQFTASGLETMQYQAVGFGPDDLQLSADELLSVTADEQGKRPFVSANVALIDRSLTPRFRVIDVGGKKIGVTTVLGSAQLKAVQNPDVVSTPPEQGLQETWPLLAEANCDLYVLLAFAEVEETKQLAAKYPQFDIVVTAGGGQVPLYQPEMIAQTDAWLVETGEKGMYIGVIGVFAGQEPRFRYQRVPLDKRFADSREMLDLLAAYQNQLKELGLDGLGLAPIPHPSGRQFVGSATCADCHQEQYDIWKETRHAHATVSLTDPNERSEIPRHFDPECLSCHVTGWNAQKYYPYESGYLSLADEKLHNNGCENCHGPGSQHVAAENGEIDADDALLKMFRDGMRLPLDKARDHCMQCHDIDNSPDFHAEGAYEEYLEQIRHW